MRLTLRTRLNIAMAVVIGCIAFNVAAFFFVEERAQDNLYWVLHTQNVINESERFLGHLRDAETGQRGYLLTGDASYLRPYESGRANADLSFNKLLSLTADNPAQQERLSVIRPLMEEKLSELAETIRLTQQGLSTEALNIVYGGEGRRLMVSLRRALQEFQAEEYRLLPIRSAKIKTATDRARLILLLEALVLIILVLITSAGVRKKLIDPLSRLNEDVGRVRAGKTLQDIPRQFDDSETGELASAFYDLYREDRFARSADSRTTDRP